jgi:hypothetical protein
VVEVGADLAVEQTNPPISNGLLTLHTCTIYGQGASSSRNGGRYAKQDGHCTRRIIWQFGGTGESGQDRFSRTLSRGVRAYVGVRCRAACPGSRGMAI